jgi:hypothetical protein
MGGLEGISSSWADLLTSVVVLIVVWTALIAGLCVIVRGKKQAEDEVQSEIIRRVEADYRCRGCRYLDRQLVHRLPESTQEGAEPENGCRPGLSCPGQLAPDRRPMAQ